MKTCILTIITFICLGSPAQNDNNSILWKISGNGLKEPSYLFGTIHAVPAARFEIGDTVQKYLDISKTLILELNPDVPMSEQLKLAQRMFLPKGKTIRDYTDSVSFGLFYSYLKDSLQIKEDKINKYLSLKPVFLQAMLLMEYIEKPKTFEIELKNSAGKKKNFKPLETLDEQLNILDSIPFELQLSLDENRYKLDREYNNLLNLYLNQDMERLDSAMFSDPQFQKMEYNLLTKRNGNWVPKIVESVTKESTFIAVGCAHLIGDEGLINLLRLEGYELQPIRFVNKYKSVRL